MKLKRTITLLIVVSTVGIAVWWIRSHNPGFPSRTILPSQNHNSIGTSSSDKNQINHSRVGRDVPESVHGIDRQSQSVAGIYNPLTANSQGSQQFDNSTAVHMIVAPADGVKFGKRLGAVHALGTKLGGAEIAALSKYLLTPSRADAPDRQSENWLRNDIMDKLVKQEPIHAGLADLLVGIYNDRSQDVALRDYAVQHLPTAYEKMSNVEQLAVRQTLWQATKETDNGIAGTALLALREIVNPVTPSGDVIRENGGTSFNSNPAMIDPAARTQLMQTALRLAADDLCGGPARITAVAICGQMGLHESLPVVTQLAQTAPDISLRIAAIAALGEVGDASSAAVLIQLSKSGNRRLQPAIVTAMRRWNNRTKS